MLRINAASLCLYHDNETVFEIYESYMMTDILRYYVENITVSTLPLINRCC